MKKVLLGTTALLMSAGVAAADVAVSGDGRMGIIQAPENGLTAVRENESVGFTSRIRIAFSASGETDGGLSFGGSVRADNSGGGAGGTAGSVFVEGSFGKISMGDVSGAAENVVGDLSGVGLTGLGDANEAGYLSNATKTAAKSSTPDGLVNGARSAMRYDYTTGALTFSVSSNNPFDNEGVASGFNTFEDADVMSVGVGYDGGMWSAGLGYESLSDNTDTIGDVDHMIGSFTYAFGDATLKVIYGTADFDAAGEDFDQYGASLDYVLGATTLTAFYSAVDPEVGETGSATGLGVAYDLGGGASLKGGVVSFDDGSETTTAYDFGVSMSF